MKVWVTDVLSLHVCLRASHSLSVWRHAQKPDKIHLSFDSNIFISSLTASSREMNRQPFSSFENRLKCSIVVSVLGSCLFFSGLLIFFIMGGTIYTDEHPKELTYAVSSCSVETNGFRVYQCRSRDGSHPCYAPIWGVTYELNQTVNTTITGTNRFRSITSVQPKLDQYQVSY